MLMDDKYVLQLMIDTGRDIECVVRYYEYDSLSEAIDSYNYHIKRDCVIRARIMWGNTCIINYRSD